MLFLAVFHGSLQAEVKPNALFSDGAVLQRGVPIPIWGTAAAGEKVTVRLDGQEASTTADQDGKWKVQLPPHEAGGPFEMTISGNNTLTIGNLLVGEVWICSGQSNMERQLGPRSGQKPLENWEQEAASANYPLLRHFGVVKNKSISPLEQVRGTWAVCSPETAPNFTAVGYYFGRDLVKQLHVPVGLIHTSWGGTPAEAWTRREALEKSMPEVLETQKKAAADYPSLLAKYQADEPKLLQDWAAACEQAKSAGKPEPRKPAPPSDPVNSSSAPSCLFNAMINPLIPYAVRGVIWYQGEANAGRAQAYQTLFPLMISDWRQLWAQRDLPFFFVQIAPFKGQPPEIREAQLLTWKKTPHTSMVVTTDVGDADDIHPARKEPVGQRLALAARALVYGEKLEYSGPVFESVEFKGPEAVIKFSHVGGGLVAKDGDLKGFTIAGADGKFVPATARIDQDTVVVSAPALPNPVAVRYGWVNVPDVNLFNKEGLPASPFRSDIPQTNPSH